MPLSSHQTKTNSILASDIRFGKPDPINDQVWSISTETGKPISLSTTFGLRARRMLVFPEFHADSLSVKDTDRCTNDANLQFLSTNFAEINLSPFPYLDAQLKVWVPNSQMIVGQMTCINNSTGSRRIGMDWLVQLDPHPGGRPMTTTTMGINTILLGHTDNLFPVFYLTGGPEESSSVFPDWQ